MAGKGWTVVTVKGMDPKVGCPFQARAWDPRARAYKNKNFKTRAEAEAWAKDESARLRTGLTQAGKTSVPDLITKYIDDLKTQGAAAGYIVEQKRILDSAVAAGLDNLRHPRVEQQAREWLRSSRAIRRFVEPTPEEVAAAKKAGQVAKRKPAPLSAATRNRYLRALKTLTNFAIVGNELLRSPFMAISETGEDNPIKAVFEVEELAELVSPKHQDEDYWLLANVMIYTGMRLGEALHLRWENVLHTLERVLVRDWRNLPGANPAYSLKFKKERIIPLEPELAQVLPYKANRTGWVIADDLRAKATKANGSEFSKYLKKCGVLEVSNYGKRTPHSTRHSYLSIKMAMGVNELAVMLIAGHEKLTTTQGYTRTQLLYGNQVKGWGEAMQLKPAVELPANVIAFPKPKAGG